MPQLDPYKAKVLPMLCLGNPGILLVHFEYCLFLFWYLCRFFFKFSILLLKIKMLFSCNSSLRCYTSSFLILLLIWENHAGFLELFTTTGGRRGICTMFCIGRVVLLDLVFSTLNVLISLSNTLLLILLITWQFKTLKRL